MVVVQLSLGNTHVDKSWVKGGGRGGGGVEEKSQRKMTPVEVRIDDSWTNEGGRLIWDE